MAVLREEEDRLRFLVSRIDSEIEKFTKMLKELEEKQLVVQNEIEGHGLQPIPVKIKPHSEETENLLVDMQNHIANLNKMKNFVSQKLNIVIKEEELVESLRDKFGEAVSIKKLPSGEFEIEYSDQDTLMLHSQIQAGKKIVEQLRKSLEELE